MPSDVLDKEMKDLEFSVTYLGIMNKIYNFKNEDDRFAIKIFAIEEPESLSSKQKEIIRNSGKYIRLNEESGLILSDYFNNKVIDEDIVKAAISYMIYGNRYTKDYSKENNQDKIIEILNKKGVFLPEYEGKNISEIYQKLLSENNLKFKTTTRFLKERITQNEEDEYIAGNQEPEEFAVQENKFPKIGNIM